MTTKSLINDDRLEQIVQEITNSINSGDDKKETLDFVAAKFNITSSADQMELKSFYNLAKSRIKAEQGSVASDANAAWIKLVTEGKILQNKDNADDIYVVNKEQVETLDRRVLETVCRTAGFAMSSKTVIVKIEYNPREYKQMYMGLKGINVFNSYVPPQWMRDHFYNGAEIAKSEMPEIYQKFFAHLFPAQESREFVLDWIAHSLKGRNLTYLIMIGEQGIGKGVLSSILRLLHEGNFVEARDQMLHSQFNGQLRGKTLIAIDEVKLKDERATDRLKALANPFIEVESKGVDARIEKNHASIVVMSNREDAITLESASERRYSMPETTSHPLRQSKLFFTKEASSDELQSLISELTEPENIKALACALYHKEIKSNLAAPFISAKTEQVLEAQKKNWEIGLEDHLLTLTQAEVALTTIQDWIGRSFSMAAPGRPKLESLARRSNGLFAVKNSSGNVWKIVINQEVRKQRKASGSSVSEEFHTGPLNLYEAA